MIRKIKLTLRNVLTESMTIHTNQENTNLTDILYELSELPTQLINYLTKIIVEYLNQNDVNVEISNIEKSQAKPSNVITLNITGMITPRITT